MGFFTDAFDRAGSETQEALRERMYEQLFMNDPSPYAAQVRLEYYRGRLKSMGEGCRIGCNVRIINPQYVSLGNDVHIGDDTTIIACGPGGVSLADHVNITDRVYLNTQSGSTGYITVGEYTYIGTGTTLFGHRGLEIGHSCLLAQNITIVPFSHIHADPNDYICRQGGHCEKVTIGPDVYIGMGVCVLYSGSIGQGSVIGYGAVVVRPIPEYSVAVGVPAKVIKTRK